MGKYGQFAQFFLDFRKDYLTASLHIITSILNNTGSHTNKVKSAFFAQTDVAVE